MVVLSHILSYFLSLFKIPIAVVGKFEKLQRVFFFFFGLGLGRSREHLISSDLVRKLKVEGGLGFWKISLRNHALLGNGCGGFLGGVLLCAIKLF